MMAESAALSRG